MRWITDEETVMRLVFFIAAILAIVVLLETYSLTRI